MQYNGEAEMVSGTKKKNNRGLSPSPLTIHMLCAHAAGRCQFVGCNKILFTDAITWEDFNNTNIAHIVASSPNGPRGDAVRSHKLSQSLDNLMLMCMDHHKLIDTYPEKYTEEILIEMKQKHEQEILNLCEGMNMESSEIFMFTSPIKGEISVNVNFVQAVQAIRPRKKAESTHGISINVEAASDYQSQFYWSEVKKQLQTKFNCLVKSALSIQPNLHFSVFPIAPIPLIAELGNLMGDKIRIDIYQKSRVPDTWKWQSDVVTNSFNVERRINQVGSRVAIILSLTAEIALERVTNVFDADVIYIIRAERTGVDCILSEADLSGFWHKYQEACDEIRNTYSEIEEICVFPAIPVSAAFELGRRYMPGVYPKLKIYEDNNGFFETLTIGG